MISYYEPIANIGPYGDLICPSCEANILTPPGLRLRSGKGKCSNCKLIFIVTQEIADKANKKYEGE